MKKILLSLLFASAALAQNVTVQKAPATATGPNKLTDSSKIIVVGDGGSISATGTGVIAATSVSGGSISPTAPLTGGGPISGTVVIGIPKATSSVDGYLFRTDWATFNAKQSALSFTAPIVNTAGTVAMAAATGSVNGYLTSSDWTTFNAKQAPGSYLTALTGDVAASGPGSAAATLATVASAGTTGSSTAIPVVTIDAKGRTTSISTAAVVAPAGTLSGATLASNVLGSSLTGLGNVTSGTWSATPIANAFLANPGVTIGTTSLALGGTISAFAGVNSMTGAATTNLTLAGGSSGATLTLQQGTGAPATLSGALSSTSLPVDVRFYGAKGDGTTDDRAAINAAITAAGANGTVLFPAGDYAISNSIAPLSGQTMKFSPGAILRMRAGFGSTSGAMVDVLTPDVTIDGCTFAGRTDNTGQIAIGVSGSSAVRATIIRCVGSVNLARLAIFVSQAAYGRVLYCTSPGTGPGIYASNHLEFNDCNYCLAQGNDFYGVGGGNGIEVYQNNGRQIYGTQILGNTLNGIGSSGVDMFGSIGALVAGNIFRQTGSYGIYWTVGEANNTLTSYNNVIENNYFEDCGTTVSLANAIYGGAGPQNQIRGNSIVVTGNVSLAGTAGISMNAGDDCVIDGNTINGVASRGIYVNTGARMRVVNNTVINPGGAGGSAEGLEVVSGTAFQIARNNFVDTRAGGARGMLYGAVVAGSNNVMVGNSYINATGAGLVNAGTNNVIDTAFSTTTLTATTINGLTLTAGTGTLTLGTKTLAASNTMTLAAGADGQTFTFPSTSATIARTDAANTFAGTQTMTTIAGPASTDLTLNAGSGNQGVSLAPTGTGNARINSALTTKKLELGVTVNDDGARLTGSGVGGPWLFLDATNATAGNRYNGVSYASNGTAQWSHGLRVGDGKWHLYDNVNSIDVETHTPGILSLGFTTFNSTLNATAYNLASVVLAGGLGVAGDTYTNGTINAGSTVDATTSATGSIFTPGGLYAAKKIISSGMTFDGTTNSISTVNTISAAASTDLTLNAGSGANNGIRLQTVGTGGVRVGPSGGLYNSGGAIMLASHTTSAGGIFFGSNSQEAIYRSGTNALKCDGAWGAGSITTGSIACGNFWTISNGRLFTMSGNSTQLNLVDSSGGGTPTMMTWNGGTSSTTFVNVPGTLEATTAGAGVLTLGGGFYSAKAIVSGSATDASSTSTGSFITAGGGALAKKLYVGDDVHGLGNVDVDTAGKTVIVKSGTNALAGTVTLVAGTATITSTAIDANTVIVFSEKTSGGTPGVYQPLAAVASGSAVVTSAATDTSTYNWIAFKVN